MKRNVRVVVMMACASAGGCADRGATHASNDGMIAKERPMTKQVEGPFEVKLTPQALHAELAGDSGAMLGRFSIDKQFHGELEATSRGEMLTAGTATKGSAGYVAMERVSGTLGGKRGTFALQHTGTMNRGVPGLVVSVVPDSGTGELEGLTGTMKINIVEKKHFYVFEYALRFQASEKGRGAQD